MGILLLVWTQPSEQDQDSLLLKRRKDNHSPGPVIRELVPSSHQRSELSNTILCIFSRWDQKIGEGILIPDSLGEEATFINICISNGSLKYHRALISTTPSFEDKVICWYTGFTFETLIQQYKSVVFPPFLEEFPFKLSKNASYTLSFIIVITCQKSGSALLLAF